MLGGAAAVLAERHELSVTKTITTALAFCLVALLLLNLLKFLPGTAQDVMGLLVLSGIELPIAAIPSCLVLFVTRMILRRRTPRTRDVL